ncbi:class I SAM-dependent methyltransferase [Stappia sp.]|jgi:SAM-dependent methyltransferase|uniref:class I SAM-dependent methyltransferase n=1 Tax=Stappia sp. TaxID=1870903 RepID=UPI003A9949C4
MSALFELKKSIQKHLPRQARDRLQEAIYFILYKLSPARRLNFFNSGYAPAAPAILAEPQFAREALQATLYQVVIDEMTRDLDGSRAAMLDIGCGLGGGMRVARMLHPQSRITGVDVDRAAARVCRDRFRGDPAISVVSGDGRRLPLDDAAFDFVFSVGAASYIRMEDFLPEATRVLRPGGLLTLSVGYTRQDFEGQKSYVSELAEGAGLAPLRFRDITAHVFAAIAEDAPRRAALISRVPPPFRGYARDWADMPGTQRFKEYEDGERLDYAAVFRKL